jgi:hypothetical protein
MNAETTLDRHWTGDMVCELWHRGARRGTVLIESGEREAHAILIDDGGGPPTLFRVENDQVPAFIAAATKAWSRIGNGQSVAVLWGVQFLYAIKGSQPGPPPPPIDLGALRASAVAAHYQLLAVRELAVHRS